MSILCMLVLGGLTSNAQAQDQLGWPDWMWQHTERDGNVELVVGLGDIDGDGYDDVGVVYGFTEYNTESGVYVFSHRELGIFRGGPTGPSWQPAETIFMGNVEDSFYAVTSGDFNSDGYSDVAIGLPFVVSDEGLLGHIEVHHGSWEGLSHQENWWQYSEDVNTNYGIALDAADVDGDGFEDLIVGEPDYDDEDLTHADEEDEFANADGRVHVYRGYYNGLSGTATVIRSPQAGSRFGFSVAGVDGVPDVEYGYVVVGAPRYDDLYTDEGYAALYKGKANSVSASSSWDVKGGQEGALLGSGARAAGDPTGDGIDDVLIVAGYHENGSDFEGFYHEGRVYLIPGIDASKRLASTASWVYEMNTFSYYYPLSLSKEIAGIGDFNGDGVDDVAVGLPDWAQNSTNDGKVAVFHGDSIDGVSWYENQYAVGWHDFAFMGWAVAGAGDVNGDGADDLIAAMSGFNGPSKNGGAAVLWFGEPAEEIEDDSSDIGDTGYFSSALLDAPGPPGGRSTPLAGEPVACSTGSLAAGGWLAVFSLLSVGWRRQRSAERGSVRGPS